LAKLLVSVRSAVEARAAVAGGASIIDVKEPRSGSLGRADAAVWSAVRAVVPDSIPVSVALGELHEWSDLSRSPGTVPPSAWSGIAFRKLGLSAAGPDWRERWQDLRRRLSSFSPASPAWVAVIYADWKQAGSPDPDSLIDVAIQIDECRGVLIDTWDKSRVTTIDRTWKPSIDRIRAAGRFVALAGALDASAIRRLKSLNPDIFAVRGAACQGGDRLAPVDSERVAMLAQAVHACL
jgi:(5-formylfuran-3-yl)methyl phosphate synthase